MKSEQIMSQQKNSNLFTNFEPTKTSHTKDFNAQIPPNQKKIIFKIPQMKLKA